MDYISRMHTWECIPPLSKGTYYAARNKGYAIPRAAPFAGKALALAEDPRQGLSPPHGPYREGRTAAPPRTLPRTVRSGRDCRLFYAPHSKGHLSAPACRLRDTDRCGHAQAGLGGLGISDWVTVAALRQMKQRDLRRGIQPDRGEGCSDSAADVQAGILDPV